MALRPTVCADLEKKSAFPLIACEKIMPKPKTAYEMICRSFWFARSLNKITNESQNNFAIEIRENGQTDNFEWKISTESALSRVNRETCWMVWYNRPRELHTIHSTIVYSCLIFRISMWKHILAEWCARLFRIPLDIFSRYENAFCLGIFTETHWIFDFVMAVEKFQWNNQHHNNNSFENSVWFSDSYTVLRVEFFFSSFLLCCCCCCYCFRSS